MLNYFFLKTRDWGQAHRLTPTFIIEPFFLAKNKEKVLKTEVFRTFRGGDKRDRTADLLNAMVFLRIYFQE